MALPSLTLLGQSLLSGLFIGALYGLLGLGLSLSWGMVRQINLAHFALAFLGAYLTYQLAGAGMDPLATLAVIVPCFFALGALMHWLLARFSVSAFNSLLVTFGLTAIIEALIQWIWTADFRRMESAYGEVKFRVGGLYVALPELLTLAMALALSLAAWAWLRHTYTGKAMRAIAEDAPIAAAFGVAARGPASPRRASRSRPCPSSGCRRSTNRFSISCSTGSCSRSPGTFSPAIRATSPSATARSSAPACIRRRRSRPRPAFRSCGRCPRRDSSPPSSASRSARWCSASRGCAASSSPCSRSR